MEPPGFILFNFKPSPFDEKGNTIYWSFNLLVFNNIDNYTQS